MPYPLNMMPNPASLSLFTDWKFCPTIWVIGLSLAMVPAVWAKDYSWAATATSSGIERQGQTVVTTYQPDNAGQQIPAGSKISQVYANRSYAGHALVHTEVCWNGKQRCIELTGQHLNTQAFNGLDPSKPMYLRHTLTNWGQSPGTLYVKGNVNVWYTPPRAQP